MPVTRAAIDTITGYYYQFDYTILKLLESRDNSDEITVEGIEDIDISSCSEKQTIQCKYYAKTKYSHSLIAHVIRLMAEDFKQRISHRNFINYRIYGHYQSNQEKLPDNIDSEFIKRHFFTYKKDGVEHKTHELLSLSEKDISDFSQRLFIDNNAPEIEEQRRKIIERLMGIFSCTEYEADYFYYNNALGIIRTLAIKQDINDRKIQKQNFLSKINTQDNLFDIWFIKLRTIQEYCKKIRKEYFSYINISPWKRFFLIEYDDKITIAEMKKLILEISKKWSKVSERAAPPFCPYIYVHQLPEEKLLEIKKLIRTDNIYFIDGHDYKGSDFSVQSICREPHHKNGIRFKFINELLQINTVLQNISTTREIYQFYLTTPYFQNDGHIHRKIRIQDTRDILDII